MTTIYIGREGDRPDFTKDGNETTTFLEKWMQLTLSQTAKKKQNKQK